MKGARCKQRKGAGVQRKTQAEQEQEQEHEHDEQPQPQRQALTRFETMVESMAARPWHACYRLRRFQNEGS